ncbi:thioesterase II family protein [Streptomyces albus]|uniref:thioesterase II family protein n=1 Tax=Streptomyces albus TaxID=1888 RepID=UPI0006E3C84B|nr:alpha/beta fold hydrolase [Streptomyces albus]
MKAARTCDPWMRSYRPGPPGAHRLVCFPHAGGSAGFYRPLCLALADRFDVWALQYPGRQDRHTEPCVTDLHTLADLLFARLRKEADRPMAFLGHSMGALLAYEVAQRFAQRLDASPTRLFVSARRAPDRPPGRPVDLTGDGGLLAEIRLLSGTHPGLLEDEETLRMILEPLRADYRALQSYRFTPAPPLRCPVTALTGACDPRTSREDAAAWQKHTTGGFELKVFPGGHFFLSERPRDVAAFVAERLSAGRRSG